MSVPDEVRRDAERIGELVRKKLLEIMELQADIDALLRDDYPTPFGAKNWRYAPLEALQRLVAMTAIQFLLFEPNEDFAALQRIVRMRLAKVFQCSGFVKLLASRVLALHPHWAGEQLDRLPFRQGIFQFWRGHVQQQRLLPLPEVQQRVSQRQVEQFALPPGEPVFRVEFRSGRFDDGFVGEVWCVLDADCGLRLRRIWWRCDRRGRLSQRLDA